jgi:hypothetical protein
MQQTWLCVSGGTPGTWVNIPTVAGATAYVTATNAPTFALAVAATVAADNAPDFGSATDAFVVASQVARVGKVQHFANSTFYFGAPGSEVLYTVPNGTYATLADLEAAMLDATGGSGAFGDFVTLSDDGTTITATAKTPGTSMNGWDFLSGTSGDDFLHFAFNIAYGAPGFANGQTLASGADAPGIIVTAGVNDTFKYGAAGSELVYTVAPGTYATLTEVDTAMAGATHGTAHLSALLTFTDDGAHIVATSTVAGSSYNGNNFLTGIHDFLVDSGFANAQALANGIDSALTVHAGVNDTFQYGAPGAEVIYTVAPQSFTTLVDVANGMASATDSLGNHWYSVGAMTNNGTKLVAHAPAEGPNYNGWDFLTGATDFLADSGFTDTQALAGGA